MLCCLLTSCVHYRARPISPVQSETDYGARSLSDPGLTGFVRSVRGTAPWPPQTLELADASLVAAYYQPALALARAQIRAAEAAMIAAGARPNPSLTAAGGYETSPESPLVIRFELSLPIETARKRSYRILEAAKLADAARIGLNEASWLVYSQVRDAWVDHLSSLEAAEALQREAQIRDEAGSLVHERLSAGEASSLDWNAARVQASQARLALKAAEGQVADSRIRLASAMGLPASALGNVNIARNDDTPQRIELLPISRVQRRGLLNRLDLQRSLLEYAAAEAGLQLEIAKQYPDIQLNPGYDFDEGHHKFTFGPAFPVPVWNRNRGAIAEAEARRSEAEAHFSMLQSAAIAQMERALAEYASTFAQFEEADRRWSAFQAAREQAMLRAVQLGEENRLALNAVRLEGVTAFHERVNALSRTRAAFVALEDSVEAPLGTVPWIPPAAVIPRHQQEHR